MKTRMFRNLMLALFLAGGTACQKHAPAETAAQTPPEAGITAVVKAEKIAPGYSRKTTYFKLPEMNGGTVDLAAYAGRPVMVMFFTETCPYCRSAAPFIEKMHKTFSPKGFSAIGICLQESADAPRAFASDLGITFPLAYKGRHIANSYKTQGVPYIYLLNKDHEIHKLWEGYSPEFNPEIAETIEALFK